MKFQSQWELDMPFLCKLGLHKWDTCKCRRCKKVRNRFHEWEVGKATWRCKHCGNPDVNSTDEDGYTPLHQARTARIARTLLDAGANPNAVSDAGPPLFTIASADEAVSIAELLLERGANVNARFMGKNAVYMAACGLNNDLVEFLILHGSELEDKDIRLAIDAWMCRPWFTDLPISEMHKSTWREMVNYNGKGRQLLGSMLDVLDSYEIREGCLSSWRKNLESCIEVIRILKER